MKKYQKYSECTVCGYGSDMPYYSYTETHSKSNCPFRYSSPPPPPVIGVEIFDHLD